MNHTVSIPAGSTADDWQPEQYRTVYGPRRTVPGREEFGVTATAAQLRDGSIDSAGPGHAPGRLRSSAALPARGPDQCMRRAQHAACLPATAHGTERGSASARTGAGR